MTSRTQKRERYPYEPDYATEPGEILLETIESLGMTQKELAARTGYTTKHINHLISGKARITPEAALRIEQVTRVPASFWNNLEKQYQERKARIDEAESAEQQLSWLKEIPTKELIKRGVIPKSKDPVETLRDTLGFFRVASVSAWRKGWSDHQIAFRTAGGAENCSGGIAAWVRLAELEAEKTECAPFKKSKFQEALRKIRGMTVREPDEFVPAMRQACSDAGVALALVPEIPGTRVNGAARWLTRDKAMIALNLRGKANDRFWFTFFHEAGHIMNDDRDEIFVDVDYADDPREDAANCFAANSLIPPEFEDKLPSLKSKSTVTAFAQQIGVHPGIVVGRLQHERIVPYTHLNGLKCRLQWADN